MSIPGPNKASNKSTHESTLNNSVSVTTLRELGSTYLTYVEGADSITAMRPMPPAKSVKNSLVFISDLEQARVAIEKGASILICLKKVLPQVQPLIYGQALFTVPSISVGLAIVLPLFDEKLSRFHRGIHPTAVVSPTASLSPLANVGPYCIIGDFAQIAANTFIGPHCVIEKSAKIGEKTILHAYVYVGAHCELGSSCEVHPLTCIGSDGFGYVKGPGSLQQKIPQIGNVVLEDFVELGAHCTIDRGTLDETRIKKGAKLDNHCHIAHNCSVGENTVLAAGFMTAGSTHIGANCQAGGMVGVSDHVHIADGVSLGGRTGVTRDIPTAGVYLGYLVTPLKEGLKNLSAFTQLHEMRKELSKIYKHLGLEKPQKKDNHES